MHCHVSKGISPSVRKILGVGVMSIVFTSFTVSHPLYFSQVLRNLSCNDVS